VGTGYQDARCPRCGAPLPDAGYVVTCPHCRGQLAREAPARPQASARPRATAIDDHKLHGQRLPGGWIVVHEVHASPDVVERFAAKLGARLTAIANQVINADAKRVQLNYVLATDAAQAGRAFAAMVEQVGKHNAVARCGRVVVEAISGDARARTAAVDALRPDARHEPPRRRGIIA